MAALSQGESLQRPGKTMPDLKEYEIGFWKKKKKGKTQIYGLEKKLFWWCLSWSGENYLHAVEFWPNIALRDSQQV